MVNYTRKDLSRDLYEMTNLRQDLAKDAVDAMFAALTAAMVRGEAIQIRGFATFTPKICPAGIGLNPKTGEKVPFPEKKSYKVRLTNSLRARING